MGYGAKLWEKLNPSKVKAEEDLKKGHKSQEYEKEKKKHWSEQEKELNFTKHNTPAGQDRDINREDTRLGNSKRDADIDEAERKSLKDD